MPEERLRPGVLRSFLVAASRAVSAVRSGDRLADKFAISIGLLRAGLFPLHGLRRLGIVIPDPGRIFPSYSCRSNGLIIRCPGGGIPYFLLCDPRHDPGVRAAIETLESGVFIDVGAHVGFFSLMAGQRLGTSGRVLAIEPHPARRLLLEENVARNAIRNVSCSPYAIGDHDGVVTLYDLEPTIGPHPRDVSLEPTLGKRFEVPMRTLDTFCDELDVGAVSMVKIDVEGFEPQVIAGMQRVIRRSYPSVIFEALTAISLTESTALLAKHGYAIRQVDRNNYLAQRALIP